MVPRALALACLLFADVMPQGELAVEALGNNFEPIGEEADRGLKVGVWKNVTLKREERWHLAAQGEWFLRVRTGIYILATHDPKAGGWFTNPLERMLWKDDKWNRVSLAPRKKP